MNILYIAHRIPYPPNKGDKLRAFHQLQSLAREHRIWCAFFVDAAEDWAHVDSLRPLCVEVCAVPLSPRRAQLRGLARLCLGGTVTEGYYDCARMRDTLRRWERQIRFDAVFAFSSGVAPMALEVDAPMRLLDLCDRDSSKWSDYACNTRGPLKHLYATEAARLAAREVFWSHRFDAVTLVTEAEAQSLRAAVSGARGDDPAIRHSTPAGGNIHVVGNGVALPDASMLRSDNHQPLVGFVGVMDYRPNVDAVVWFAEHCWPAIRREVTDAQFQIIGRNPTAAVRRLERIGGVRVLGAVDHISPAVSRLAVSVAPLRIARGVQNKVLEAMAHARAVVLSPAAAIGVGAQDGVEYRIADSPTEISAAVVDLLRQPSVRQRMGEAARAFVASNHQWERELMRFRSLLRPATARRRDIEFTSATSGSACYPMTVR